MSELNEIERVRQQRKESIRWILINACSFGGRHGITDTMALQVVVSQFSDVDRERIRAELTYLEGKELITIEKAAVDWRYFLTADGVDVVEGNAECPVGIRCPEWK